MNPAGILRTGIYLPGSGELMDKLAYFRCLGVAENRAREHTVPQTHTGGSKDLRTCSWRRTRQT